MPNAFNAGRTGGSLGPAHGPHSVTGRQGHKPPQPSRAAPKQQQQEQQPSSSPPQHRLPKHVQQPQRQRQAEPTIGLPSQVPTDPNPHRGPQRRKPQQPSPAVPHPYPWYDTGVDERQRDAYAVTGSGSGGPGGAVRRDGAISGGVALVNGADDQDVRGGIYSPGVEGDEAGDYLVRHTSSRTQTRRGEGGWTRAAAEHQQEDEEEEPLRSELAEELRELERLYGAPNRTRNSYRSRQERLDRRAAARAAVYGPRHRDADVRLLAMRREAAAAGSLRRRGRFATDDAMPRRSTWHKLPPQLQQQILDERASELLRAVGLSRPAGRRLYLAAPGLLCDISYGVANRLRALASRLGVTVEAAAAAIAARPLLGELRPDILEATAAELTVWLGGMPLPVLLQRLVEEPAVAADGPAAVIARCQALSDSLGLMRLAALQLMLRNPRLMALEPHDVTARVAAARRVVRQAAEAGDGSDGAATRYVAARGAAATAATVAAGGGSQVCARIGDGAAGDLPPPGLMLCTEAQLDSCLRLLQQLLPLSRPAAARLLVAQPALALQPAQSIRAAVDFLAAHLPPPPLPPSPRPLPPSVGPLLALLLPQPPPQAPTHRQRRERQRQQEPSPPLRQQRQPPPRRQQQQQLPPPHVLQLVMQCPDALLLEPRRAAAALDCLTKIMAEVAATAQQQQVTSDQQVVSYHVPYGGDASEAGRASGTSSTAGARPQRNALIQPDALVAHPDHHQLDGLADVSRDVGHWQAARGAAAALVRSAPRLLLCRLLPPDLSPRSGPGSRSGSGWGAMFSDSARERQTSILAWVKAVDEAQRKRRIDASSLALDGSDWPLPILSLPYNDYDGDSDATKGDGDRGSGVGVDEQQLAGREGPYGNRPKPRSSAASAAAAAASLAALRAAAAAAGAAAVPIDIAVREAELLQLLGLELSYGGQSVPYGSVYDTAAALLHLRLWLWQHLVPAAPSVLLLPSSRLAATVDQLCSWLAVPPPALAPYLIPACPPLPVPGLLVGDALAAPPPLPEVEPVSQVSSRWPLPRHHVALLSVRPEALQRAAYRVWSWLGGGGAAAAADVAAVLRALPGLLYDSVTMRLCALVLHAALGGGGGSDGYGNAGGSGGAAAAPVRARVPGSSPGARDSPPTPSSTGDAPGPVIGDVLLLLPAWALVLPPPDVVATHYWEQAASGVRDAQTAVPAMPPEASVLLLLHPAEILCDGVLRLLQAAPPSVSPPASAATGMMTADAVEPFALARGDVSGTGPGGVAEAATVAAAGVSGGGTRLGRTVRQLSGLLGISRLAAAVLLLATRGSAAELLEQLPPSAMARVEKAMLLVHRGGAWRRELQRYLYGRTAVIDGAVVSAGAANLRAYSAGDGRVDEEAGGGLESLEAVSASAEELLVVVREWRRVGRLEALEAAGLETAVSYIVALQMREEDWQALAVRLGLTRTAANTVWDG